MSEVLNETMENNEIIEVEEINDVVEFEETTDRSFGSVVGVGAGLLALGGCIYLGVKKIGPKVKAWDIERKIKKLETSGYMVYKAEDVVDVVEVESDDVEETEE